MTDTVLFILEIVGTAVFAASGALAGLQRQLDAFGVVILGVCTACGGGVIRDLTLGITPPVMFCQPVYALVAMGVSALVFLPAVRHLLAVESRAYELVMLWLDSIGLGLFTVVGVQCAFQQAQDYNLFLLRGQGEQIKAIRQRLGLTQKVYAAQLGVPLQKFKRWEQGNVQIFKSTWEKYFKQSLESCK